MYIHVTCIYVPETDPKETLSRRCTEIRKTNRNHGTDAATHTRLFPESSLVQKTKKKTSKSKNGKNHRQDNKQAKKKEKTTHGNADKRKNITAGNEFSFFFSFFGSRLLWFPILSFSATVALLIQTGFQQAVRVAITSRLPEA